MTRTLPVPPMHALRYAPTATLLPYANNARLHSEEQIDHLCDAIKTVGFTSPLIVAGNDLLAGHGRLLAAERLGMPEVPCLDVSNMPPALRRAYILADNLLALQSDWDPALLAAALRDLHDSDRLQALSAEFTDNALRTATSNEPTPLDAYTSTTLTPSPADAADADADADPQDRTAQVGVHLLTTADPSTAIRQLQPAAIFVDNREPLDLPPLLKAAPAGAAIAMLCTDITATAAIAALRLPAHKCNFSASLHAVHQPTPGPLLRSAHATITYGWKLGKAHTYLADRRQDTIYDDAPLPAYATPAQMGHLLRCCTYAAAPVVVISRDTLLPDSVLRENRTLIWCVPAALFDSALAYLTANVRRPL